MSATLSFDGPLPASGQFIKTLRQSCTAARLASDITISEEAIDAFVRSLDRDTFERLKGQHGVSFPLTFPSIATEVNFLSILALLNTLSAYRRAFHEVTGQGAYQNVTRLLMGMYISSPDSDTSSLSKLSAQGLATLTETDVATLLNVPLHSERPHDTIPGLIVGTRGGPLLEPIQLVVKICNDTGKRLLDMNAANLGEFVIRILIEANAGAAQKGDAAGCELFVDKLVSALPGFADMTVLQPNKEPVYLFKKAFFLLFALRVRLAKISADLKVPDIASLPMFVDNVIPTMLVHYKILQFGPSAPESLRSWAQAAQAEQPSSSDAGAPAKAPPTEGPLLSKEDAYRVRAAALDAGTVVVARMQSIIQNNANLAWLSTASEVDLDGYLWAVAKDDPKLRKVPRLVERGTVMY
ncbi:hypothetical protein OC835_006267 [Tilletia horrida]|nr:hypothetical protein OC835_006267 [Tilletia horrida]